MLNPSKFGDLRYYTEQLLFRLSILHKNDTFNSSIYLTSVQMYVEYICTYKQHIVLYR